MDDFMFRRGRFSLPSDWLDSDFNVNAVKRIMGECFITRAEHMHHSFRIEYIACSYHFRPVERGELSPEYEWVFNGDNLYAKEIKRG